ncbi:hypothetical protein [Labrenzia sp. DG1229]|uniref:hypothetical protein n=1 Tax=Labrenzia sp. DG1229 TaxID=681847 RepID=UPI00048B57F5|nr:hypothetical protein [Labrenzia sp. DG1229]
MFEPQAPKTKRAIVRDTFTSPRIGLLSWAFAAVLMGTVGLASYQFSGGSFSPGSFSGVVPAGVRLPDNGSIETTASIGVNTPVAVMNLPERQQRGGASSIEQSQIEVLQREVVGLRRRLVALSEQNLIYSRRIAALEQEVARTKLAYAGKTTSAEEMAAIQEVIPRPGVVVTKSPPKPATARHEPAMPSAKPASNAVDQVQKDIASDPVKKDQAKRETVPGERIDVYRQLPPPETVPAPELSTEEPVRIITPSNSESASLTTASIPPVGDQAAETFNETPTRSRLAPKVITPSDPSGQIRGGGDSQIKRSDFGAVIGHYRTSAGAAKAWADFKEQNEDRMRDLRPLIRERQAPEGGVALMIGPFANAADAAVACLRLLDTTEVCRPALYAGDPLVTAAEFRDSAF